MILILSIISRGLEFWSVNGTPIYENPELKVFMNKKSLDEICNNWPKDLSRTNAYKTLEFCS